MAATLGSCQGIWLARLLGEMHISEPTKVRLKVDNHSAISLSKHIDVRYHFVRECVEARKIDISYVRTEEQLVDILTKSLGKGENVMINQVVILFMFP
jgi:hypothetical protein